MKYRIYRYKNIRVLNNTGLHKESLHKFIDFCLPKQLRRYKFNLIIVYRKHYKKFLHDSGMQKRFAYSYYYPFCGICTPTFKARKPRRKSHIIIVTIRRSGGALISGRDKRLGYLSYNVNNPAEDFVGVLSHELMHICQNLNKMPNTPKRETEADLYAIKMLKKFRREAEV